MEKEDFYRLLKAVPKAELHLHAEAVITPKTVKDLYFKSTGSCMTDDELNKLFAYVDLAGFLESFLYIQTLYEKSDDLSFMFKDFSSYLSDNNIVYVETFFSPTMHIKKGRSYKDMISVIDKSISEITSKNQVKIKVLIDVSRSFGKANAMNNLNFILDNPSSNVIGIGLGGDEQKGKPEEFIEVYKKAQDNNLHTVVHAGEVCDSSSIKDSIKYLHTERIGHGISSVYDSSIIEYLRETQIPLEVCPTSNIFTKKYVTSLSKHPIKKLYEQGLNITLNTDDPVFFKVSLIDEYWNLYNELNFSLDDIKQIILNGFKAAFITDEEKSNYCAQVEQTWDAWMKTNSSLL